MTALRLTAQDSRVRSVVALAPPTDMTRYMRAMELLSPARYSALAGTMGTPEERPDLYRRLSALSYADAIRVPVLLVCGTQDLHAPLDHSQFDAAHPVAQAVALFRDRFVAVGRNDEVRALAKTGLDLEGHTVLPGLIDNHTHQLLAALDTDAAGVKVNIARLVVLSDDFMTVPVHDIPEIRVEMTMVGGQVVYRRPIAAPAPPR